MHTQIARATTSIRRHKFATLVCQRQHTHTVFSRWFAKFIRMLKFYNFTDDSTIIGARFECKRTHARAYSILYTPTPSESVCVHEKHALPARKTLARKSCLKCLLSKRIVAGLSSVLGARRALPARQQLARDAITVSYSAFGVVFVQIN